MTQALRVLVIDDEEVLRQMLSMMLKKEGYKVSKAEHGEEGLKMLMSRPQDLVLCDINMPVMGGLELLGEIQARGIDTMVIAMSAFGNRELAVKALRAGAFDYIDKPFKKDEILLTVLKAKERLRLIQENIALKQAVQVHDTNDGIIGSSDAIERVMHTVNKVAAFDSSILLRGESGTGKELVARAIHKRSSRAEGPWIAVNCGAIPPTLLESEFFGHIKGAFTDAHRDKKGLFEEASGGTLFLDEIAELPLNLQVKLLRVLQEREVRPVGSARSIPVDVRVVAASLHDLQARVEQKLFRQDLYYRLNVIQIELPPLRARLDDLPKLVAHFLAIQNARMGTQIEGFDAQAMKALQAHAWPGNIRELQNCIERAMVMSTGNLLDESTLPDPIRAHSDELHQIFNHDELSIKRLGTALERVLIRRALTKTQGNRTNAAKLLEISHRALLYKIKEYGLENVR